MSIFMLPRLTDEKQFEHLVADCYRALFPSAQVDEYGRRGQKQYGIDIIVQIKTKLWCIQCKNYERISVSDIDELLKKCTYYNVNSFEKLIIATAALSDTKIEDYLVKVRSKQELPFDLEYFSWERICSVIENNSSIYQKYYGLLQQTGNLKEEFLEIVKKYEISAFLRIDPMTEGLIESIPIALDQCKIELQTLLDSYIERANDNLYFKIDEFMQYLEAYNGYLSITLFPAPSGYKKFVYLPPINGFDEKKSEKECKIFQFKKKLTELMHEIAIYMQ